MYVVVRNSLNLEVLLNLLMGVAKAFEVAYTAVANVPSACLVVDGVVAAVVTCFLLVQPQALWCASTPWQPVSCCSKCARCC